MKATHAIFAALLTLTATVPALAHHSFAAEFDGQKPFRVTGALVKIEWTNPHTYFYVDAKDDARAKLGDTIIVDGYLARDGSHLMDARRVTLPDGRIVSGASAGDGGPGSETQVPAR